MPSGLRLLILQCFEHLSVCFKLNDAKLVGKSEKLQSI